MGFLHSLYGFFVKRPSGGYVLLAVDAVLMAASILGTIFFRTFDDGSYGFAAYHLGADVLTGTIIGITIIASFNSIVYFGAFGYEESKSRHA